MYREALIETTDDNTNNNKDFSNLKISSYEKANLIDRENDHLNYDRKVFNSYLNKIQNCEEKIKLYQILGYVFIIIFFALLVIKYSLKNEKELKYYYLLLPSTIATMTFSFSFNYFLRLKQLIEKEEEDILSQNNKMDCSMGNFLSYLCLNLISFSICVYFFLLALKLENAISETGLSMVNIPIYISLGIIFFYFIFILPAFLMNKLYWGIILIASYLINAVVFLILLSMKLDHQAKLKYAEVFVPVLIALGIQFVYAVVQFFIGDKCVLMKLLGFCSVSFIIGTFFYLAVVLDLEDARKYVYKVSIMFLISATVFSIEKIASLFVISDDEEKE